jgi:hypothetical protein
MIWMQKIYLVPMRCMGTRTLLKLMTLTLGNLKNEDSHAIKYIGFITGFLLK